MRAAIHQPVSNLVNAPRWFVWLPGGGIVTFSLLYVIASSVYSGAADVGSGYNHFSNYWCDLLALTSSAGQPNHARPFALLGTCLLPLSLVPLWYNMPVLFVSGSRWGAPVRIAGAIAMLCATLVWTSLHDIALNVVAVFGFIALATTLLSLDPQRHRTVLLTAWLAGALVLCNYALWATGTWLWILPAVQKVAFLALFAWVGVATLAIARELATES
jgi:hypothetical protein